jgi:hypothetical protein
MTKSVITIEKEFFEDNGVQMVKRGLKENDIIIYQFVAKVSEEIRNPFLDDIEEWVDDLKKDNEEDLNDDCSDNLV